MKGVVTIAAFVALVLIGGAVADYAARNAQQTTCECSDGVRALQGGRP